MNAPTPQALTHADIKTIADALGISKQACQKRANKEAWGFILNSAVTPCQ